MNDIFVCAFGGGAWGGGVRIQEYERDSTRIEKCDC